MASTNGIAAVFKATRIPGEVLKDWKAGWDKLTDADKAELIALAEAAEVEADRVAA